MGQVVAEDVLGGMQWSPGDALDEQVVDGHVEGLGDSDDGGWGVMRSFS
jgi:hypothetical protein